MAIPVLTSEAELENYMKFCFLRVIVLPINSLNYLVILSQLKTLQMGNRISNYSTLLHSELSPNYQIEISSAQTENACLRQDLYGSFGKPIIQFKIRFNIAKYHYQVRVKKEKFKLEFGEYIAGMLNQCLKIERWKKVMFAILPNDKKVSIGIEEIQQKGRIKEMCQSQKLFHYLQDLIKYIRHQIMKNRNPNEKNPFASQKQPQLGVPEEYKNLVRQLYWTTSNLLQKTTALMFQELMTNKHEKQAGEQPRIIGSLRNLYYIQLIQTSLREKLKEHNMPNQEDFMNDITKIISNHLTTIIPKVALKYPQASLGSQAPKLKQSIVNWSDRTWDLDTEYLYANGIKVPSYGYFPAQPQNYITFLIKVINRFLGIPQQKLAQDLTMDEAFTHICKLLYIYSNSSSTDVDTKIKKSLQSLFEHTRQFQGTSKPLGQYLTTEKLNDKWRMDEYLPELQGCFKEINQKCLFKIGLKLPSNLKEIGSCLEIKNTSILRILSKLTEDLEVIFKNPQQEINRYKSGNKSEKEQYTFKDTQNKIITLTAQENDCLISRILAKKTQLDKDVQQLKSRLTDFQKQVLSNIKSLKSANSKGIGEVELASVIINAIHIQFTFRYLCILIKDLVEVGLFTRPTSDGSEQVEVNLVSFRIGDLMRCKFECSDIEKPLDYLCGLDPDQPNENETPKSFLRVVRINNKLEKKEKVVLTNQLFGKNKGQIQFLPKKNGEQDENLRVNYEISHYLYQLERGPFGPIPQLAAIACQKNSIINSWQEKKSPGRENRQEYTEKCSNIVSKQHPLAYRCRGCQQLVFWEKTSSSSDQEVCNLCYERYKHPQQEFCAYKQNQRDENTGIQINRAIIGWPSQKEAEPEDCVYNLMQFSNKAS